MFFQGKLINAVSGLSLFGVAVLCVVFCSLVASSGNSLWETNDIALRSVFLLLLLGLFWSYGGVNDYDLVGGILRLVVVLILWIIGRKKMV